jgi:hypothetical protein
MNTDRLLNSKKKVEPIMSIDITRLHIAWIFIVLALMAAISLSGEAFGGAIYSPPAPNGSCSARTQGGTYMNGACAPNADGTTLYGAGQKLTGTNSWQMFSLYDTSYVPFSGKWRMAAYYCPASTTGKCTISDSTIQLFSAKTVSLVSTKLITDQSPDFGGGIGTETLPTDSRMCFAFVDSLGQEWRTPAGRDCEDGHVLPDIPATCYINYGENLNVNMGTLERGMLATTPQTTTPIKREISVLCTRDAGTDVNYHFQYTPVAMANKQLIPTNLNGIGIAIIHNGNVVSPTDTFSKKYAAGYSSLDIEFEAIRDPTINIGDVGTGKLSANAVLVMDIL